jgi:uncharacterized protein YbbC (DUF1343 family)
VKPGIEVLLGSRLDLLRGRRVGLVTNPTAVDARLRSTAELLRAHPEVNLVALYGPEHGVRGDAQAGEYVPFYRDPHLGLPVFSLYGETQRPPADMLTRIDAYMREYDTRPEGKTVEPRMLESIEVMVFDLQDVGTRVYTYVATMAYAMQAAAEAGIPFVVLDRPNPINGTAMEGPILRHPQYSSFIGLYPVPLRHGMTAGELARLFNARFLPRPAALTVVPMEGWRRGDWFETTGLPWVLPSPNLPSVDAAVVYPGQVMLEGTTLSEGRGTTRPFELCGAPWLDGHVLARDLNGLELPGVRFREAWFTPTFSKFAGQRCGGVQLHVSDRATFRPILTTIALLAEVRRLGGDQLEFHADYFDRVLGHPRVREGLLAGVPAAALAEEWAPELRAFAALRQEFLLYDA